MKILQFPLARISLFFVLGIYFFGLIVCSPIIIFACLTGSILTLLVLHFYFYKARYFKNLFGVVVLLTSFLSGIYTAIVHKETYHKNHYVYQIKSDQEFHTVQLVLSEKLKNTKRNIRFISKVLRVDGKESTGNLILNIRKPNTSENRPIGSILSVKCNLYKNRNPFNPNQFDYGKYLENQEIYAQAYTNETDIKAIGMEHNLWSSFSNFRSKIINNLVHSGFNKEELNVLIALILGQQQDISPETLKDYQYAGAVHVLSVSGLHVGFILLFITYLLKPIPNTKRGSLIKLIAILLSLWSFALLAGLLPTVVRSATMFSFVAIGNHLKRTVNIFHSLLVSILLILLWKPSFLFDIGFQLSYLALFFILWLQPIFSSVWIPKNKIIKYFWDIITVSFAAQIGALPLSIFYFNQFPGLFFITNLVVLPLLGIIMAIGLLVIIVACFTSVPLILVEPLELSIYFLNSIIHYIASFDQFIIINISFTRSMLWTSYVLIVAFFIWIKKPNFQRLIISLICILCLQGIYIYSKYKTNNSEELIVFNIRKNTLITLKKDNQITVFGNDSLLNNLEKEVSFHAYKVASFSERYSKKKLENFMYFKNKKIAVIDNSSVYLKDKKADILIITNSPKLNLERLLKFYRPNVIIADGSNYKNYVKLWEATCEKEKIPFHNTNEKGFYKLD